MNTVEKATLTVSETATCLGISPKTVHRLVAVGALPRVEMPEFRRLLFPRQRIEAIARGEEAAPRAAQRPHVSAI
jgi:hypothetical protein